MDHHVSHVIAAAPHNTMRMQTAADMSRSGIVCLCVRAWVVVKAY